MGRQPFHAPGAERWRCKGLRFKVPLAVTAEPIVYQSYSPRMALVVLGAVCALCLSTVVFGMLVCSRCLFAFGAGLGGVFAYALGQTLHHRRVPRGEARFFEQYVVLHPADHEAILIRYSKIAHVLLNGEEGGLDVALIDGSHIAVPSAGFANFWELRRLLLERVQ